MANGAYKKASEMANIQQMLPKLLEQARKASFSSKQDTYKQRNILKENLEKILQQYFDLATRDARSNKTLFDKVNPIARYQKGYKSAKRQKDMLNAIKDKLGLEKYKKSIFQEGIKGSTERFRDIASTIDPSKTAMAEGIAGVAELTDLVSKASGIAGGISEISKLGLKPFLKGKMEDLVNPLEALFSGEGGVASAKDLASKLAESLKLGEGNLKKFGKKAISKYDEYLADEEDPTEELYFDPSDYFKYLTQDRTYL